MDLKLSFSITSQIAYCISIDFILLFSCFRIRKKGWLFRLLIAVFGALEWTMTAQRGRRRPATDLTASCIVWYCWGERWIFEWGSNEQYVLSILEISLIMVSVYRLKLSRSTTLVTLHECFLKDSTVSCPIAGSHLKSENTDSVRMI